MANEQDGCLGVMQENRRATLLLEDGRIFRGRGHGFQGEAVGEVVFNTSMTGYQEILTDPSYEGQIVTMTYPLIGNTGINPEDVESRKPFLEAFVVRRMSPIPSNWRTTETLENYLTRNKIPVISEIDTRALVRHIRLKGSMRGIVSLIDHDAASLARKVRSSPEMVGADLASKVTIDRPYENTESNLNFIEFSTLSNVEPSEFHVVAYDFGIKSHILRNLVHCGARVTVVPSQTSAEDVLQLKPDGIFLSNGPGDPEAVDYAIRNVRQLMGKKPIFGICLGHQIMGLAFGGRTYKLKFGHHGNHVDDSGECRALRKYQTVCDKKQEDTDTIHLSPECAVKKCKRVKEIYETQESINVSRKIPGIRALKFRESDPVGMLPKPHKDGKYPEIRCNRE